MNKLITSTTIPSVAQFNNDSSNYSHPALNSSATQSKNPANDPAMQFLEWLNLYYLGALVILGVLGNAANFIFFIRTKTNNLRSPSYYLAALALNDAIFLLTIFIIWLNHFDVDIFEWFGFHQVIVYFSSTSSCMSGI
jgi:hypothetical protein